MPPKVKIQNPPKFCAGPHEDVIDWIDRYETIGAYNGWDDTALRKFFIIYLDGPARHWYQCKHSTFPQIWASTPEVMAGNVVQVQAVKDTKEFFWKTYKRAIISYPWSVSCGRVCKERMKALSHTITIS